MTKTQLTLEIVDPGVGFDVGSSRIGSEEMAQQVRSEGMAGNGEQKQLLWGDVEELVSQHIHSTVHCNI